MIQGADRELLTPLMRQYVEVKDRFSDTLLFFQVGDFYELFWDDAKTAAAFLGIALTKRGTFQGQPIPLCGVPVHAKDHYLVKLVKGGFKVALVDQLEEPKPGSLVARGVTQVYTPGTLADDKLLDEKSASYLMSFFPMDDAWGLLFGELLTSRLFGTILPVNALKMLDGELARFSPDEILVPSSAQSFKSFFAQRGFFTSFLDQSELDSQGLACWIDQFSPEVKETISTQKALKNAIADFYKYVAINQACALDQFKSMQLYNPDDFLVLDSATMRNLEIIKNVHDGGHAHTLFSVLDGSLTSMGSRTIKKWLSAPLVDLKALEQRHEVIEIFVDNISLMQQLAEKLKVVGDMERLVGRIALGRAAVSDYCQLLRVIEVFPPLKNLLRSVENCQLLSMIETNIYDFDALRMVLASSINDDLSCPYIIKKGFDVRLDELRDCVANSHQKLIELEQSEQQKTGINSLKIRYNQMYGYSIEVTKTHLPSVPDYYIRLQTLVGKERYTIPVLQQLENDLKSAQNSIAQVEQEIFARVKQEVVRVLHWLRLSAYSLSRLDALFGLAQVAYDHAYVRPSMHDGRDIVITEGRHPVVERALDHNFIPNSVSLTEDQLVHIITGPNMGGKSTFLRQVALTCVMAQAGSFVPAKSAKLPILDRIFTRIGAGDNLAQGKSTFLVEMEETALICTQATERSLVILDEVGRGTSTFDGMALAQAIVEFLATTVRSRSLFATHYHELTLLKDQFGCIANFRAACTKTGNGILFLYHIEPGAADGSFGLDVAQLAGLPQSIVARAHDILHTLENAEQSHSGQVNVTDGVRPLTLEIERLEALLKKRESLIAMINEINIDELSPKKAFDLIWTIKKHLYC